MFNVKGTFYGRDGETQVNRTNISFEEMRRTLTRDLYMGTMDEEVIPDPAIPFAFNFAFEEAEASVIALGDYAFDQLKQFVAAVNDEGQLFIEGGTPEDDKWADGDSMSDEDRNAAIIG